MGGGDLGGGDPPVPPPLGKTLTYDPNILTHQSKSLRKLCCPIPILHPVIE